MITRLKYFFSTIFERAMSYNDAADQVIVVRELTKKEVKIVLYDYVNKSIQGYLWATNPGNQGFFVVERIAANKGWGPFLYEILMQSVYPMSVKPSQMIRPEAISVWKKFLANPRIKSQELTSASNDYAVSWKPDEFAEPIVAADELQIINRLYKMEPYPYFRQYIENSETTIKDLHLVKSKILSQALEFFQSKYYVQVENFVAEKVVVPEKDITDKYLLINKTGNNNIEFLIQDKSKIYAYGELTAETKYYQTKNIAAEQGWGPFLYDCIMLMLDKPIHPSVSLTTDSFNVLNNYIHHRPDVIKTLYPGKLHDFVDLDQHANTEEKYYKVLNYLYTINNTQRRQYFTTWYQNSLAFEQQMTEKMPKWKEVRFNQAKRWFNMQYLQAA